VLPSWIQRLVAPSLQAAGALEKVAEQSKSAAQASANVGDSLQSAQQQLNAAVSAYASLANSGTATADQLQRAGVAVAQASMRLDSLRSSAAGAAQSADALKTAFSSLGISSQRICNKLRITPMRHSQPSLRRRNLARHRSMTYVRHLGNGPRRNAPL
jgi:chromosome segregation ATPase